MEGFINKTCNELALGSLERDADMKQQISQALEAHYNTRLVKSLKEQIDILQSEILNISIKMIHGEYLEILPETFKFQLVANNEVKKEIENLDTPKSSTYFSIPAVS